MSSEWAQVCKEGLDSGGGDFHSGRRWNESPAQCQGSVITYMYTGSGSLPGHPPSNWVPEMVSEPLMASSCIQSAHSFP